MALPGAFDVAVRGCAGVVHCASVTNFSPDPTEVITPSIAGALNLLESAAMELSIKRVVVTSSTMAASAAGANTRAEIASDSWNMSAFSAAWQPPPYDKDPMRPWEVYCSSKLQMEQAAWRWCGDHRPHFVLNTGTHRSERCSERRKQLTTLTSPAGRTLGPSPRAPLPELSDLRRRLESRMGWRHFSRPTA